MKRLLVALAAAALPFTASASPELAGEWGIKAGELREETASLIASIEQTGEAEISRTFETEIERFAFTATRLGHWIDGNNGPSDLGCIFRGMAEEGEVQLDMLSEADGARETRAGLVRLATMFADAEVIAIAAAHAGEDGAPSVETAATGCPVSAGVARAALK